MAKAIEVNKESTVVTAPDTAVIKDTVVTNLSDEELERELAAFDDEDDSHEDDDDEAVYLQQLGLNFGLSSRSNHKSRVASRSKRHSALSKGGECKIYQLKLEITKNVKCLRICPCSS